MTWGTLLRNRVGVGSLGYRFPDKAELNEEARKKFSVRVGFDEQFEDGPFGETFFFFGGIGRPVRVSEAERADACDRWGRHVQNVDMAYLSVLGLAVVGMLYFGAFDRLANNVVLLLTILAFAGHFAVRRVLSTYITRPFNGRMAVGPARTRWAHYSAKANAVSWQQLGGAMASLLSLVLMRATFAGGDAFHRGAAMVELMLGSGIFLIAAVKLKNWFGRR